MVQDNTSSQLTSLKSAKSNYEIGDQKRSELKIITFSVEEARVIYVNINFKSLSKFLSNRKSSYNDLKT